MKRELLCEPCWSKLSPVLATKWGEPDYSVPGEGVKTVRGALIGRSVLCDSCGSEKSGGDVVVCLSIYSEEAPYFKWEHEFVGAKP